MSAFFSKSLRKQTICETISACTSTYGAQVEFFNQKRGRKSRDAVPLSQQDSQHIC